MRRMGSAVLASGFLAAGCLVVGIAPAAVAVPRDIVDDGEPGLLTLQVDPLRFDLEVQPGDVGYWLITPRVDATGGLRSTIGSSPRASWRRIRQASPSSCSRARCRGSRALCRLAR